MEFNAREGTLRCEAGARLDGLLEFLVPRGFFLPVLPGTKFVSVGGAIANDIHGKNHHRAGSFGCHVKRLELLRSDGERIICSPDENRRWFEATIGGLGLTGVITWAEIRLKKISGPMIEVETIKFSTIEEFIALCAESESSHEYTVAWLDLFRGRGVFMRGNHLEAKGEVHSKQGVRIPCDAPEFLLNNFTFRIFDTAYYHLRPSRQTKCVSYDSFFFPLDGIGSWNRLYGKRGFLQYQCLLPIGPEPIYEMMKAMKKAKQGSALVVGKTFGDVSSSGMLSFPKRGLTVTIDFPNTGRALFELLEELDKIALSVYPAKDARMAASSFKRFYPQWDQFRQFIDPAFSSSFWRRVTP